MCTEQPAWPKAPNPSDLIKRNGETRTPRGARTRVKVALSSMQAPGPSNTKKGSPQPPPFHQLWNHGLLGHTAFQLRSPMGPRFQSYLPNEVQITSSRGGFSQHRLGTSSISTSRGFIRNDAQALPQTCRVRASGVNLLCKMPMGD